MKPSPTRPCPMCKVPVEWGAASPHRPFCSERCRLLDLGAWASESYRIPAEGPPDDDAPAPDAH
ncbi:DNA gyrase inhibitor YacG [Burkholderiales bacterium]|nr:DNA gyrase inhibitor YacG [Burkholderiales bacterium]